MSKLISIVIPVHNEQENISLLSKRLIETLKHLELYNFQVIYIDDGSTDRTIEEVKTAMALYPEIGYVKLSGNYGHQSALEAGISAAAGDAVITMDGDLQHPPEIIPEMLRAFDAGAEIVQMQRKNSGNSIKGLLSVAFYTFFKWISRTPLVANAADFRLISKTVADQILISRTNYKLLRAIIPSLGYRQVNISYIQHDRYAGTPSYSYFDSCQLAIQTIFNFSKFPVHLAVLCSAGLFAGGLLCLLQNAQKNLLAASILISSSLVLTALSVVSWYLYFILQQLKREPGFKIEQIVLPGKKANLNA